ncbi:hypothetical protein LY78DRAFT_593530 [Colletotrichum sublineola]|uniref:Putative saccharopine dehydrogenase n=1 Tax=Colletotrichum sublineola TaxID=1173701 RepID=A0A066X429_COLSU|nr:hypothetical protein LY78DRAFT_593530 [Colletotrichum sublineola]KDN62449.1 putative saccharopine dehydrogenase [Colletotrichum sublineola]
MAASPSLSSPDNPLGCKFSRSSRGVLLLLSGPAAWDSVSLDEQTAFRDNPLDTLKKTQFEECNRGIGMLQHKLQMTKVGRLRETQTSALVEDSQWYHYQARRPRTYKVQDP